MRTTMVFVLGAGLLGIVGCSNLGTEPTSTSSRDSDDLKQRVQSKLASDPELKQLDVSADAAQNQVILSGSLTSEQLRNSAVELAKTASENLTVIDKIEVRPQTVSRSEYTEQMAQNTKERAKHLGDEIGQSLDDAWIYTKIEAQLAANSHTPATLIHVDVVQNVVTLKGQVDSARAKDEAERIAKQTEGVKLVRNLLTVSNA